MIYGFGPFSVDTTKRRLWRGDEIVSLTPKAFDTLVVLVSSAGHVVDKEELLKTVWPDTFVEDATLAQNIATIRRALGDTAENPVFIATVPRRGYRFLGPVTRAADEPPGTHQPSRPLVRDAALARSVARGRAWMMVAAVLAVVLVVFVTATFRSAPPPSAPIVFSIPPPPGATFSTSGAFMAISPDGNAIAFVASRAGGADTLWIRSLDTPVSRAIDGTEGASQPFWSADSRSIAFFANGKLKRVATASGQVQTICSVPAGSQPLAGTWNDRDDILFSTLRTGILRVSAAGGVPALAIPHDEAGGHQTSPQFLPDGRHFLYAGAASEANRSGLRLASIDTTSAVRVNAVLSSTGYADPGYLLFVDKGDLVAQRFDPRAGALSGETMPIAEHIAFNPGTARASFSASRNGVLAYRSISETRLVWVDRGGVEIAPLGRPGGYLQFSVSPGADAVAAARLDPDLGTSDIDVLDVASGSERRLTFDRAWDQFPVWSPDGAAIAFASNRDVRWKIFEKAANGDGAERVLFGSDLHAYPESWSSTRGVLFVQWDPNRATKSDFWLLRPDSSGAMRLPDLEYDTHGGRISPDGRWLAYESYESARAVYVRPLQSTASRWQISSIGGSQPAWRADGRELFFLAPDLSLMAVDVEPGPAFRAGPPRRLFQTQAIAPSGAIGGQVYDVSPDGQRFLIKRPASLSAITVIVNWPALVGAHRRR